MEAMKPAETKHRKEEKHSANRSPQGTKKIPPKEKNIMALGRIPPKLQVHQVLHVMESWPGSIPMELWDLDFL